MICLGCRADLDELAFEVILGSTAAKDRLDPVCRSCREKAGGLCLDCGEPVGEHGAMGLCRRHHRQSLRRRAS